MRREVHIPHRSDGDAYYKGIYRKAPRKFTFHTGQMETIKSEMRLKEALKFTFHTGQMETLLHLQHEWNFEWFTFHTGQMETEERQSPLL